MNTITDFVTDAWDTLLGRIILCGLAVGWVPFYILSKAHEALS